MADQTASSVPPTPPTPARLYLYDDLPFVRAGARAESAALLSVLDDLAAALRAEPNVIAVDVEEQIARLAARPAPGPFPLALALGAAGARVAERLHRLTGWFPRIRLVAITREELPGGGYRVRSAGAESLEQQLSGVRTAPLALVDDTIYSGATLLAVLERLPDAVVAGSHVFCLQGIAAALAQIRARCPVAAGIEIEGAAETEVSVIKASHLFEPGAIRPAGAPELAFYERPAWIRAWFPRDPERIIALCEKLHRLLTR